LATENVARKYEVSREEQDEFALRSHQRAAAALDADKFKEETVPVVSWLKNWMGVVKSSAGKSSLIRTKVCAETRH